ncbi:hypothetical protein BGX34_000373 [Mortierella sp. NVP85]|nr:hypothetical protein BGX34_000373 [Mortierella sp. NVP85]
MGHHINSSCDAAHLFTLVSYIALKLHRAGGTSLYFDERLKSKYGPLYDQYLISAYWFFVPVLGYQILKAAIVGLGRGGPAVVSIAMGPQTHKTPNHPNNALSFVRVLTIVMLAVLIEGTTVSTVSRTVPGVIIAGTQALMMLVLTCLIFYQLGKVLWQLRSALRSRKQAKEHKKTGSLEPLDNEEVLAISVKDEEKYKNDSNGKDKDDEPQGRMASEHLRSAEV